MGDVSSVRYHAPKWDTTYVIGTYLKAVQLYGTRDQKKLQERDFAKPKKRHAKRSPPATLQVPPQWSNSTENNISFDPPM